MVEKGPVFMSRPQRMVPEEKKKREKMSVFFVVSGPRGVVPERSRVFVFRLLCDTRKSPFLCPGPIVWYKIDTVSLCLGFSVMPKRALICVRIP